MASVRRGIDALDGCDIEACDVLIFTAIEDLEAAALDLHLARVGAAPVKQTSAEKLKDLHRWVLPQEDGEADLIILTRCLRKAGNGIAGIELSHLLHTQHRPRLVIFCGIGGSLDVENAQLGNVVVSNSIQWRGFDKISGDSISKEMRKKILEDRPVNGRLENLISSFVKKNNSFSDDDAPAAGRFPTSKESGFRNVCDAWLKTAIADEDLREDLEKFHVDEYYDRVKPIVKIGKIMSWDFVLNKKDIREDVKRDNRDFFAVEMETGGMALAARRASEFFAGEPGTEILSVRGISDLCNKKTDDVFRGLAADHAAAFLTGFLKSGYDSSF